MERHGRSFYRSSQAQVQQQAQGDEDRAQASHPMNPKNQAPTRSARATAQATHIGMKRRTLTPFARCQPHS
jgi:hypothetical protein